MRTPAVLLALVLSLSACGQETGSPRASDPSAGTRTSYLSDGLPSWAHEGDAVHLDLGQDTISFTAGCNQFSGTVKWEYGGSFEAGSIGGTEMGCEPHAMDLDTKIADFFQRADHITRDGTDVQISAGDESIWFVPSDEMPGGQALVDLEGTTWRLTGIGEYDGDVGSMMEVPDEVSTTLVISGDDIQFGTGCNSGSGHVRVDGDELVLSDVGTTTLPCPRGPVDLEGSILAVLGGGRVAWSINGKHLMLLTDDHKHQLDYEAE